MRKWVVKIGGSLHGSDYLQACINELASCAAGRVVLVCGGGPFADTVRQSQKIHVYDDATAHRMALLAMHQYAHLLASLNPKIVLIEDSSAISHQLEQDRLPLWLPYKEVHSDKSVAANWDMTSDGLAAWLAIKLDISRLLLIKSTALPVDYAGAKELSEKGLMDASLAEFIDSGTIEAYWLERQNSEQFESLLNFPGDLHSARLRSAGGIGE